MPHISTGNTNILNNCVEQESLYISIFCRMFYVLLLPTTTTRDFIIEWLNCVTMACLNIQNILISNKNIRCPQSETKQKQSLLHLKIILNSSLDFM